MKTRFLLPLLACSTLWVPTRAEDRPREYLSALDATPVPDAGAQAEVFGAWADEGRRAYRFQGLDLTLGLTPRLALGLTLGRDDAPGRDEANVAHPYAQIHLTPPESRFRAALRAGYALTNESAEGDPSAGSTTSSTLTAAGFLRAGHVTICGPEYGPDAPPCEPTAGDDTHDHPVDPPVDPGDNSSGTPATPRPTSSLSSKSSSKSEADVSKTANTPATANPGTAAAPSCGCGKNKVRHREADGFRAALLMEADLNDELRVAFNLLHFHESGDASDWGYAAALHRDFGARVTAGLEATGDFEVDRYQEAGIGLLVTPVQGLALKLGAGWGLTDHSPDFVFRGSLAATF